MGGKKGWMKTGFGMTAYNDGKAEQKRELASDKKYNNIKPDIGFFGEALNWGGGAKGDDLSARAKKNGLTNDQQMWRDSGALSANESARAPSPLCVCPTSGARRLFVASRRSERLIYL